MEIIDGFTYIALSAAVLFSACELAFRGVLCLWPCVSEVKKTVAETLQDRHVVSTDRYVEDVFVEGV